MIEHANPNVVTPDFGTDESVFEHPFRIDFCVYIRSRMNDHDHGESVVVAIKIDAVFATKPHAPEFTSSSINP